MTENELSSIVIHEAIDIHKAIGPGLLEKVYAECLCYRLSKYGLKVTREQPIPVIFEEVRMDCGYRADLIIEGKLLIEVKSIEAIADVHKSIILTYLKFANCKLGLLINFNVVLLKDGIKRIVNGL
jgi:GxxExxY protein